MSQVQEIFEKLTQAKKELRGYKATYKNALDSSENYKKICDDLCILREKRRMIELHIQKSLGSQFQKIEDLTSEVKNQQEMLNDVAIVTLMKEETVEAQDEFGNKYAPKWSVKFKKDFQKTLF